MASTPASAAPAVETRSLLRTFRAGRTVLLTTHYMAEADELCDRIAIIDRGRVLACDSAPALRRQVQGGQHVELEVRAPDGGDPDLGAIGDVRVAWGAPHPERGTRTPRPPHARLRAGLALGLLRPRARGAAAGAARSDHPVLRNP